MVAVVAFPFRDVGGVQELLLPMLPTQILWINLVATVALALPLAFEAKEPDVMRRAGALALRGDPHADGRDADEGRRL